MRKEKELTVFSKRLTMTRSKLGLTAEQLAKKLVIDKTMVSRWENVTVGSSKGFPNLTNTFRVAEALGGVSVDWLWGVSDSETPFGNEIMFLANVLDKKYEYFRMSNKVCKAYEDEYGHWELDNPQGLIRGIYVFPENEILQEFVDVYSNKLEAMEKFKDAISELKLDEDEIKRKIVDEYIEKLFNESKEKGVEK